MCQVKVVTPRAELAGEVLIGETCVYFVPDNPDVPLHADVSSLSLLQLQSTDRYEVLVIIII